MNLNTPHDDKWNALRVCPDVTSPVEIHSNFQPLPFRDIKSANVMLMPEGVIKLIDFGCARKLELRLSKSGSQLMK